MEYSVEHHIEAYPLKLKINIINNSDNYYVLPFDINGFKGYYESEYCGALDDKDYPYHFFAPTVMLKKQNAADYIFPASSQGHLPEGEDAEKYIMDLQRIADKELKEIDNWKKKYHYKSYEDALRNYYITKNLLILKPHERFTYDITLDLGNIRRTNTSMLYDYYSLEFTKYDLSLDLCINKNAYNALRNEQKVKFKNYKFFEGTIKSNTYSFKAYE